jgi:hypothetical protein
MAKKIGVTIKPSLRKGKKIDVFSKKTGDLVASIGDITMSDYPHYMKEKGIEYANERKRLYHIRHRKDKKIYSKKLLW